MDNITKENLTKHLIKLGLTREESFKALETSIAMLEKRDSNIELDKPNLKDLLDYSNGFDINIIKRLLNKAA